MIQKKIKRPGKAVMRLINYLSKATAVYAFRNGPVEDMHAAGKLTQEDMKTLNKYMVDRLGEVFFLCFAGEVDKLERLLDFSHRCTTDWDDINEKELSETLDRLQKEKSV